MKLINLKIINWMKNIPISLKATFIFITLIVGIIIYFNNKINKLEKELKEKNNLILELELQILDNVDYQTIKKEYDKKTDTTRIITSGRIDTLLSRYYY